MENNSLRKTADEVMTIAHRIAGKNKPIADRLIKVSERLVKYAQYPGGEFDPSMEPSAMQQQQMDGQVNEYASEPETTESEPDIKIDGKGRSGNPGIESFVKIPEEGEAPAIDDRDTHSCTIVFKAPKDVGEDQMMAYVLGMREALGVDASQFKWQKQEAKVAAPSSSLSQ